MAPWALSPSFGFVYSQDILGFERGAWKMRNIKLVSALANDSLY